MSDYEAVTGHRRQVCEPLQDRCHEGRCMVCDLYLCAVCGALEGALLPRCPGRRLTMDEHDENYAHYCAGTGPFAEGDR